MDDEIISSILARHTFEIQKLREQFVALAGVALGLDEMEFQLFMRKLDSVNITNATPVEMYNAIIEAAYEMKRELNG